MVEKEGKVTVLGAFRTGRAAHIWERFSVALEEGTLSSAVLALWMPGAVEEEFEFLDEETEAASDAESAWRSKVTVLPWPHSVLCGFGCEAAEFPTHLAGAGGASAAWSSDLGPARQAALAWMARRLEHGQVWEAGWRAQAAGG